MAEQTLPFTIEDIDEEMMSKRRARGLTKEDNMVTVVPSSMGRIVLPGR